jgi:hypothetical protein
MRPDDVLHGAPYEFRNYIYSGMRTILDIAPLAIDLPLIPILAFNASRCMIER